jgi:hypothetical protein
MFRHVCFGFIAGSLLTILSATLAAEMLTTVASDNGNIQRNLILFSKRDRPQSQHTFGFAEICRSIFLEMLVIISHKDPGI